MEQRSRTEYSLLNIFVGLGGYLINTILGFICRMVFARCLSADYLGVNGLFTNLLNVLSLAELGIGSAIVFALYKPLAKNDINKISSLVHFYGKAYQIIGIIVAIIGLLLMPFIDLIIQETPNITESIYILYLFNLFNTASTYFFSYKSSLIIAAQQNYIVTGVNYIVTIMQSVFQSVFLILTHNYLVYLVIQSLGTLIYNITISKIAVKKFPFIKNKNARPLKDEEKASLFKNIKDLTIYKISGLLVNSTDNILITFFNGLAVTGITSNYTLLTTTLNSLLNQVFNGVTASIGNHNALENSDSKYSMFSFLNMMNFWIFGWATLGIVFCATDIVELCFGSEYKLPISIVLVMALNFYTVGLQNAVWTYKQTLGLFHYGRFLQLITAALNVLLSIILGNIFGVGGILFATFIARFLTNLWYDPYAVFTYGFNKSFKLYIVKYIRYLFILIIAAVTCYVVLTPISTSIFAKVVLKMLLCSVICNLVFYISLRKTIEFQKFKEIIANITSLFFFKYKNKRKKT